MITWSYDANGNTVGITPPDKPKHDFSFTPVDLVEHTPDGFGSDYAGNAVCV